MWTVARAKPGQTHIAIANLLRQQFEYYAPRFRIMVIRRHKKIELTKFLFSNYLFVETDDRWMALNNTYGISGILLTNGYPASVSPEIIDELKAREGEDGFYRIKDRYSRNQRLRAKHGIMAGRMCICEGMPAVDRVKVLFTGLGFEFHTIMEVDDLESA